jgi:diguanylate cyclase (GGDEF)-like protein/PAS domain S-box-containing protein
MSPESVSDLSIALEELQVATEELQVQNEDLCVARKALEIEHRRYQELFDLAPDGYLVTTIQGVIQEANQAAETLFNLCRKKMVCKPFIVFVGDADRFHFHAQMNHLKASEGLKDWEISLKPRVHSPFLASISISIIQDSQSNRVGLRWLIRDISDRKQAKQMRHDAFHDSLTGLANRALLLDRLGHLMERYQQRHQEKLFALLFIDLDRFKPINDSLGHFVGDQVLIKMACRLETCMRREDTLARLGGDEFVILLEEIHKLSEAEDCALRVQEALSAPMTLNSHTVTIQASIGIVLSSPQYQQSTYLLRDADIAMYQAKEQGGGCFQVFTSEMHTDKLKAFELEQELQLAIQKQELEVYYQPIVSLSSQKLTGFEALARWPHRERGLLSPSDFLHIAKKTGLIASLDLWMLAVACQQMVQWRSKFAFDSPLTISVNLSSRLFAQPNLAAKVQAVLQETGLDPRYLMLEITEEVIMKNVEQATITLNQLRDLQLQLTIDDFGTGYSSLSRLQRLPFQGLKIDRTFLNNIEGIEMVKAIAILAHTLGLFVIAEGAETESQVQILREAGCEYAQGYYLGRPESKHSTEQKITSLLMDRG